MSYKKEMGELLAYLKNKNHGRRIIEKNLGYAPKSLDQIYSQGGNENVIIKLRDYKRQVDGGTLQTNIANEDETRYMPVTEAALKKQVQILEGKVAALETKLKKIEANSNKTLEYLKVLVAQVKAASLLAVQRSAGSDNKKLAEERHTLDILVGEFLQKDVEKGSFA